MFIDIGMAGWCVARERPLRQREIRVTIGQTTPYKYHGSAGGSSELNQAGDIAVDLRGRQHRCKLTGGGADAKFLQPALPDNCYYRESVYDFFATRRGCSQAWSRVEFSIISLVAGSAPPHRLQVHCSQR